MSDFGTDAANDERSERLYRDIVEWCNKMGKDCESMKSFFELSRKSQSDIWSMTRKEYLSYRAKESAGEMNEKLGTNIKPMSDSDTTITEWFKTWCPNVDKWEAETCTK